MNKEIYYIKSREYLTLNKIIIKSTVYINIIPIFISYPYTFVCNYIIHRALIFTDLDYKYPYEYEELAS